MTRIYYTRAGYDPERQCVLGTNTTVREGVVAAQPTFIQERVAVLNLLPIDYHSPAGMVTDHRALDMRTYWIVCTEEEWKEAWRERDT